MNNLCKYSCLIGLVLLCYYTRAQLAINGALGVAYSAPRGAGNVGGLNSVVTYYDRFGLSYKGGKSFVTVGLDFGVLRKGDDALRTDNFSVSFYMQPAIKNFVFLKFGLGLDYMYNTSSSDAYYLKQSYYHRYYEKSFYFLGEISVPFWKKETHELSIGAGVHLSLSPYYQVDINPGYGNVYLRNTYYYGFLSYRYKLKMHFKSSKKQDVINSNN